MPETTDEKLFLSKSPEENIEPAWKEFLRFLVIALIVVVPFRLFIAQPFIVSGTSMVPTFENSEYLIVDELSYRFHNPARGDVIILKKPREESEYLIKRVIGLPGDTIIIKNGAISIKDSSHPEGFTLNEPYILNHSTDNSETTLGNDEYFVMGDNRPVSLDSRFIGPIPKDHIVGRTYLRLFPVTRIGYLPGFYQQ